MLLCVLGSKSPHENRQNINHIFSTTLLQTFEIEKRAVRRQQDHETLHRERLAFGELEEILSPFPDLLCASLISGEERCKLLDFFVSAVQRAKCAAHPFDIRQNEIRAGFHAVSACLFTRLHIYYSQEFPAISPEFLAEYINEILKIPREHLSDFEIIILKDLLLVTIYSNNPRLFGPLLKYLRSMLNAFDHQILIEAFFVQAGLRSDLNIWEFIEALLVVAEQITDYSVWHVESLPQRLSGKPEFFLSAAMSIIGELELKSHE
jgi:hypothetical protein